MTIDVTVPVLIVGGGGAGLTCSMLLSQLGVDSLLVSALPTTSTLPKAHVLNQRSMEILRGLGVDAPIYQRGTPREHMRATAWYAGFAGPSADHGRCFARMEAWGAGCTDTDWIAASACSQANLPQIRLEPILRARAEALAPGRVRFHHELTSLEQDADGVTASVADKERGARVRVRARHLLACDGGRTVARLLGIGMEGERGLMNEVSVHMTADLSRWARDPDVLIRWIWVPETSAFAVLVPMGPEHWGPHSEEWVFHLNYREGDHRAIDDAQVEADMRAALGIGAHPIRIHEITRWSLEGVVAQGLQLGHVFLLGDAAHRHPPTGGLGLNSAIQDAHNLCWKIALVERGQASARLLETYAEERRPVVVQNVRRSVENARNHLAIAEAIGLSPEAGADENWRRLRRLWSDRSEDAEHRRRVRRVVASQSMEFREHNVEYGYTYASPAIVADPSPAPEPVDAVRLYQPSTRPGHPLPHAWIEDEDGERRPLMDLVRPGRFLLIGGERAHEWCDAGRRLVRHGGVPLDVVTVGHLDGDYLDPRCQWMRHRGIGAEGAVLVRPDRFVAWRCHDGPTDAMAQLGSTLERILHGGAA